MGITELPQRPSFASPEALGVGFHLETLSEVTAPLSSTCTACGREQKFAKPLGNTNQQGMGLAGAVGAGHGSKWLQDYYGLCVLPQWLLGFCLVS